MPASCRQPKAPWKLFALAAASCVKDSRVVTGSSTPPHPSRPPLPPVRLPPRLLNFLPNVWNIVCVLPQPCGNVKFKEKMICGQQRWDHNCVVPHLVWSGLDLSCLVSFRRKHDYSPLSYLRIFLAFLFLRDCVCLVPTSRGRLRQLSNQPFDQRQAAAKKNSTDSGGSSWNTDIKICSFVD